jgi:hypothetical protein
MRFRTGILVPVLAHLALVLAARGQPVQIREDFSRDPGWDHLQNRIVGTDMPQVVQDFGWRRTNFTWGGPGEIGRRVANSRRQACYAMPLGRPLSSDDEISASGALALRHVGLRVVGYVGFCNSGRHTWRVWNSMAFRVWEEDGLGQVMFDWLSSDWRARGAETALLLEPDGKVHSWSFRYEPGARADPVWHDRALERHVTDRTGNGQPYEIQGEEHLFARLKKEEPDLTREALHARLLRARDQGLVEYFHRHNRHRWWKRPDAGKGRGRVTLRFDRETPYVFWFDEEIRRAVHVRPLRPVQHRPVRHGGGDVPRWPDGQRPEARPVPGPALGGPEQRVAVHRQDVLPCRADLARYTSCRSRLPATARFKESAMPTIGMRTRSEQRSRWIAVSPRRSSPRTRTVGRG